jgi:hypothetical protein
LGLTSPPSPVLCSATTAICPSRCPVLSLVHRYLSCNPLSLCPRLRAGSSGLGCFSPTPGLFGHPGPPHLPVSRPGNRWLSQVPRLPLWLHAPLFDPGGVLSTCLSALRTVAFHSLDSVGFPAKKKLAVILMVHNYTNFEAQSRGLHPRFPWLRTLITEFTRRVRY